MNASLFVLALASVSAAPQDVLYDFYSTSCGPCQMMMPVVHQLAAEGYPVKTIDIGQRPDLAERFGVQMVPTFILVIGGQERQRLVGWQEESTMRGLLAQIPNRRQLLQASGSNAAPPRPRRLVPVKLTDDDSQGSKWNFHLPLPSFTGRNQRQDVVQIDQPTSSGSASAGSSAGSLASVSTPASLDAPVVKDAVADASTPPSPPSGSDSPPDDPAGARGERAARSANSSADGSAANAAFDTAKMLGSSVRIRVKDGNGVYFGSGVVIESGPGKSIVLTCGHILRDVREGSRIEIDVFDGKRSHTYRGGKFKFDLESDLGLVLVKTASPLPVSPVASAEGGVRAADRVVSIGCSQGEPPSVERLRVTVLNRYLGPDTIECTGVPGQGRSGGGLFTAAGSVVGICTNADPHDHRGVYAGLKPIHELLRTAGLEALIPAPPRSRRESLAEAVKTEPAGADEPRTTVSDRDADGPRAERPRGSAKTGDAVAAQPGEEGEISQKVLEQSEVICIIRPVNQPKGASRVVVINRASRKFMAYLTGEMKDQLLPAMGHTPRDDRPAAASKEPARTQASGANADEPNGTTAAWKPTGTSH